MKVSKNFWLTEFIPPEIYEMSAGNSLWFIDQRIITIAQYIRDRFKSPVTINNWFSGGHYRYSGYRDPLADVGVMFSQHKFGRAIDAKVDGFEPEEIRTDIITHWPDYQAVGLTTIEADTPTWTHLDCRNTGLDKLYIVKPK